VPLLAAKAIFLVLLCPLGVGLALPTSPAVCSLVCVVKLDVEEVFLVCGFEVGARAF
jgi:hypothetical protein